MNDKKFDIKSAGAGGGTIGVLAILLMPYVAEISGKNETDSLKIEVAKNTTKYEMLESRIDRGFLEVKEGLTKISELFNRKNDETVSRKEQQIYAWGIAKRLDEQDNKILELKSIILSIKNKNE